MFTVRGRVLAVTPREQGTFSVTLLGEQQLYVYGCIAPPPKLGQDLVLLAERVRATRPIQFGTRSTTLAALAGVRPHPDVGDPKTPTGRVVAPAWRQRVRTAMTRPLRSYQEDGAAWLASRLARGVGSILGDEQGTGKTTQTIAALCATQAFPAVIVAPKSLLRNWEREWSYSALQPKVTIVRGREGPLEPADVYVLTYGTLQPREQDLGNLRPKVMVFDEAHLLKEPKPKKFHRAAVATRLGLYAGRCIFLTGTPVLNRPQEAWRLLHLCDAKEWPDYEAFRERYCCAPTDGEAAVSVVKDRRIVTDSGRVEHLDELRVRIEPYFLRRLKEDVLHDLPPKTRSSLLVEIDKNELLEYRAAEKDLVAWLREQGQELQAKSAKRAEALVRLTHLRRLVGEAKVRAVVPGYLREFFFSGAPRRPLIVFGYFRKVCQGVQAIAERMGLRVVAIRGDDDEDKRQAAVDAFQAGEADVFVAPIKAAGVGITLHRSSDVLFVERSYVQKELEQAEDRAHRLGQSEHVTVTYLDAVDTIDEQIAKINEAKVKLVDGMIDDKFGQNLAAADEVVKRYASENVLA